MPVNTRFVAAALVAALVAPASARAGGDCCGGGAKGGDKPVAKQPAKRDCWILKCDKMLGAKTEAALAKLAELDAAAAKRTAEQEKALSEARRTLASSCPLGKALTASAPAILKGIAAVADCPPCPLCPEPAEWLPDDGRDAVQALEGATARAAKLGRALVELAARYSTLEAVERKAGSPKEEQAAADLDRVAKDLDAAHLALSKLTEAERAKFDAAAAKLDELAPGEMAAVMGGWQALFAEMDLARKGADLLAKECASVKKEMPAEAAGRMAILAKLGAIADASGMRRCGSEAEGCGSSNAAKKEGAGGCCGAEQ